MSLIETQITTSSNNDSKQIRVTYLMRWSVKKMKGCGLVGLKDQLSKAYGSVALEQ